MDSEASQNEGSFVWKKDSRPLSRGSFGIVTKWTRLGSETEECVAVKRFLVQSAHVGSERASKYVENCTKEVERMTSLEDLNIVQALSLDPALEEALNLESTRVFMEDQELSILPLPVLCMEFCDGGDLRHVLAKPENLSGLQEDQVRDILSDMSKALMYLHEENVVHRDIKPSNILLQHGYNTIYKLGDFGLSRDVLCIDESFSTKAGTPMYQAPDFASAPKVTYKVDYWSLGMTIIEVCYGSNHFRELRRDGAFETPIQCHLPLMFCEHLKKWFQSMLHLESKSRGGVYEDLMAVLKPCKEDREKYPQVSDEEVDDDSWEYVMKERKKEERRKKENPECANALEWMLMYLELPRINITPMMSIVLNRDTETVRQIREFIRPPVTSFPADALVIYNPLNTFRLSSNTLAYDYRDPRVFTWYWYTSEMPAEFTMKMPGSVGTLFRRSSNADSYDKEKLQRLWIDSLFYFQHGIRLAEHYLAALECLKIQWVHEIPDTDTEIDIDIAPPELTYDTDSTSDVTMKSTGDANNVQDLVPEATEPSQESKEKLDTEHRKELLQEIKKWFDDLVRHYDDTAQQPVTDDHLNDIKRIVAFFSKHHKMLMDSILTEYRYRIPGKVPKWKEFYEFGKYRCVMDLLRNKHPRSMYCGANEKFAYEATYKVQPKPVDLPAMESSSSSRSREAISQKGRKCLLASFNIPHDTRKCYCNPMLNP